MSSQVISPPMVYNTNADAVFRMQQQQLQRKQNDEHVLDLNNRACVLVLSNSEYSEAIKLYDTALMIHKEQTEEESENNAFFEPYSSPSSSTTSSSSTPCNAAHQNNNTNNYHEGLDYSCHSSEHDDHDFSETEFDDDFGDMDWDGKDETDIHHSSIHSQYDIESATSWSSPPTPTTATQLARAKIPRMTTASRLRTLNYCGQQEYHEGHGLKGHHHFHHQVYSLPIVMEESEWDMAPVQDKTFVLIFNTALCNHLWGMQLMQQYIAATTSTTMGNSNAHEAVASLAEHCRETLTIAKLLYKLALENSVSFANGVDKMCYVALYNNLSHVLKTLEGYDSAEAQWCDDMLLKAIFWWRDSNQHHQNNSSSNSNNSSSYNNQRSSSNNNSTSTTTTSTESNNNISSSSDLYLDDDSKIIDAFFENIFYRIGVSDNIVPAAAA